MPYSGSGGVWAMKGGDFQATNFPGTGAGIQAAIDYAAPTSGTDGSNGQVYVAPGNYTLTAQINIPYGVRVFGGGSRSTRLVVGSSFTGLTTTGAVRLGSGTVSIFGSSLEDLMIECGSITGSIGVYSSDLQNMCGLKRVLVNNFLSFGLKVDGTAGPLSVNGFFVEDSEFYKSNSGGSGGTGIYVEAGTFGAVFKNCVVFGNPSNPLTRGYHFVNFAPSMIQCAADGGAGAGTDAILLGASVEGCCVYGFVSNGWTNVVNISGTTGNVFLSGIHRISGTNVVVDDGTGTPNAVTITDSFCPLYVRGNNSRVNLNLTTETLTANTSLSTPTAAIAAVSSASTAFGTNGVATTVTVGQGTTGSELALINIRSGNTGGAIPRLRLSRNTTDLADFLTDGTDTFIDFTGSLKLRGAAGATDYFSMESTGPVVPGGLRMRFNGFSDGAGAGAGTLLNAPAAGNPAFWLKINIAGTDRFIPCW